MDSDQRCKETVYFGKTIGDFIESLQNFKQIFQVLFSNVTLRFFLNVISGQNFLRMFLANFVVMQLSTYWTGEVVSFQIVIVI